MNGSSSFWLDSTGGGKLPGWFAVGAFLTRGGRGLWEVVAGDSGTRLGATASYDWTTASFDQAIGVVAFSEGGGCSTSNSKTGRRDSFDASG